ncbi:hypothetical protein PLICRDRAFT_34058 [Plicaturopsis crispa FD-325 SS-3]|nr:hypothetical protein PLICRDRAFT_34058 [Plicaturopsis crispa FD-325 SS-3]
MPSKASTTKRNDSRKPLALQASRDLAAAMVRFAYRPQLSNKRAIFDIFKTEGAELFCTIQFGEHCINRSSTALKAFEWLVQGDTRDLLLHTVYIPPPWGVSDRRISPQSSSTCIQVSAYALNSKKISASGRFGDCLKVVVGK